MNSPSELKQSLRRGGHSVLGPGQEVELRYGAGLAGALVLQVEASDEVVVAPDVLAH